VSSAAFSAGASPAAGCELRPRLIEVARSMVGIVSSESAQDLLRSAMLLEALRRSQGNFTRAAALLRVHRQSVQQMVARYDLHSLTHELRSSSGPSLRAELGAEVTADPP
jgi:transcriptional regulator of acetoin/glycerol metabolism